jgi:hypothetical protein
MLRTHSRSANTKLTEAARRLLVDQDFLDAFRRDPVAATAPLRLSVAEVEALKSGDDDELARLGMDVRALQNGPQPRFARMLRTIGRIAPGLAGIALALGVWAAPSHADSKGPGGARRRSLIRRSRRARGTAQGRAKRVTARARRVTARAARDVRAARRRAGKRVHRGRRTVRTVRVRAIRTVRAFIGRQPPPPGPKPEVPFPVG